MRYAFMMTLIIVSITTICALAYTAEPDVNKQYCEMVELYHNTGGEYGWPPYKGENVCNDD